MSETLWASLSGSSEATHISVFERREEETEKLNTDFSALEMAAWPPLSTALNSDLDICLVPYIVRLAAHRRSYKLVVALLSFSDGHHLERLINKIFDCLFPLSETAPFMFLRS